MPTQHAVPANIDDIPGWLRPTDQRLINWLLSYQETQGVQGDLCELGAYLGKSAVLIGAHVQPGEKFTVCDLFDSPAPNEANAVEMLRSYATLTRSTFERNYLAFHDHLPAIVEGPTSTIGEHVAAGSCRFVHVDASHHFGHVSVDVASARAMLQPDGVVVFDDYRAAHTPGVAAAVWFAIRDDGLCPVWISPNKMYATWGDPTALRKALVEWLTDQPDSAWSDHDVAGHRIVQIADWPAKPSAPPAPAPPPSPPSRRPKHPIIVDLLPPAVTRALRAARRRRDIRRRGEAPG